MVVVLELILGKPAIRVTTYRFSSFVNEKCRRGSLARIESARLYLRRSDRLAHVDAFR